MAAKKNISLREVKKRITTWLPGNKMSSNFENLINRFDHYMDEVDGAAQDGKYIKLARTLQGMGEYIEWRVKERRYPMHLGVIGDGASELLDGVLFESVGPGKGSPPTYEPDPDAMEELAPRRQFPNLYRFVKAKAGKSGFCKVTIR